MRYGEVTMTTGVKIRKSVAARKDSELFKINARNK